MGTDNPKQPGVPDYGTISEDEEWIITRDKLFLFTEADIRGTDYWADPDPDNYEYGYIDYPTPDEKDFTYDGKAIIPRAILKEEAGDTFPRMTALRSPVPQSLGTTITGVSVFYQMRPGGEGNPLIDYMLSEAAKGTNNFSSYYCFAGVWVQLSPEA